MPDGERVDTDGVGIVHQLLHLRNGLAEADHDARLGADVTRGDVLKHAHADVVLRGAAHAGRQAADGLEIVRDHLWLGRDHLVDKLRATLEVGNEHLYRRMRIQLLDAADGKGPVTGTEVGQIVPVDGGDDGVAEAHQADAHRHVVWLRGVERMGTARQGVAEAAGAGADVATDHERGCAAAPAFALVGALAAGADRVQAVRLDNLLRPTEVVVATQADLQPVGLANVRGSHQRFSRMKSVIRV